MVYLERLLTLYLEWPPAVVLTAGFVVVLVMGTERAVAYLRRAA